MAENKQKRRRGEAEIDNYSRVLQMVAVVALVIVLIFGKDIPVYVKAGLLGVAVGLNPDQIYALAKEAVSAIFGKKR
jgi:hypothetical protein